MDASEFDKFAEEYEAQHAENIAVSGESPEYFAEYKIRETKKICDSFGLKPTNVLDFGAGIGNSTPHIKHYFPDADQISADVSIKSLEILSNRFPNASENRLISDTTLPLDDDSVDLAFTACVFHHIDHADHIHWLSELRRVVRPGGIFTLFEHNPWNPLTVSAVNTCPFDENAKLINALDMRRRLSQAGFDHIKLQYHVFFPAALKALRPIEPSLGWLPLGGQYSLAAKA
ncbi:class I SAM-dependent methyltransferase [Hyphococcus sp. DH-69]|uniref:class I SAM-dependent methyltransferase n=1 Tax=Hyphococcus formosus TaxID=3143534 RepID=UPI00398B2258